ncbi:TIGR04211 family SH3 domain-containing protein [Candidatus Colwellia aromaticivorans]|uniref:TIGR04211 family SH3 domain-containing protein n=1 Tax=Candidatus Colwellia aromaticivorans TaxID=2267621 RepID=UPI001FED0A29|nr:TIGR04211 family SH3 domain-containing protein [Candidatus Colwellia aromaticivorans]
MKMSSKVVKQKIKQIFVSFTILLFAVISAQAQETNSSKNKQGFISDDLSIYMHTGPGTNYRILGTINAGSEIKTTGKSDKGYSEIIDDKNRNTWVETKYLTTKPGLRFVVAELNGKIAGSSDYTNQLDGEVNQLRSSVEILSKDKKQLSTQLKQVEQQLKTTMSKVKDQDTKILTQRFYNGAIVLSVGLILGLIIPRFFARRRSSMDSWS